MPPPAVDSICLSHTLAFRNLLCGVHMAPKLHFLPYLVIWWPWPLILKFSEMLNTVPISHFDWWKFLPTLFKSSYMAPKLHFCLNIFGHEVTLTFGFQILRNTKHCPSKSFPLKKVYTWYIWMDLWMQNCTFAHIRPWSELDLWPLDLNFSKILNNNPISLSAGQKFFSGTFERCYGSTTEFLVQKCDVVTLASGSQIFRNV